MRSKTEKGSEISIFEYISSEVSVGLLQRSLTNFLLSVVGYWLLSRHRTAESVLKWKNKAWSATVIAKVLFFKPEVCLEVR